MLFKRNQYTRVVLEKLNCVVESCHTDNGKLSNAMLHQFLLKNSENFGLLIFCEMKQIKIVRPYAFFGFAMHPCIETSLCTEFCRHIRTITTCKRNTKVHRCVRIKVLKTDRRTNELKSIEQIILNRSTRRLEDEAILSLSERCTHPSKLNMLYTHIHHKCRR